MVAITGSGLYREKVTVQSLKSAATRDAGGQLLEATAGNWETYHTTFAAIVPAKSTEFNADNQNEANIDFVVTMHWDSTAEAITTDMRLSWNSRTFNIVNPPTNDGGQNRMLTFGVIETK